MVRGVPEEGVAAEILEFVEEREAKNSLVTSQQAVHSKGTLHLLLRIPHNFTKNFPVCILNLSRKKWLSYILGNIHLKLQLFCFNFEKFGKSERLCKGENKKFIFSMYTKESDEKLMCDS